MFKKLTRILLPVLAAVVMLCALGVCHAGASSQSPIDRMLDDLSSIAEEWNPFSDKSDSTEASVSPAEEEEATAETTPPETELQTEPPETKATEPPTEWVPAYVETEPPQESGYEEEYGGYHNYTDPAQQPTDLNAIKIDKSISNKTYNTDNTAGIVSWICVGVGLIVILVMLLSTKLTGNKAAGREP